MPTILSGASGVELLASCVVFDAMGRKAADLKPGVYFVVTSSPSSSPPEGERVGVRGRQASGMARFASSVIKVVVTR